MFKVKVQAIIVGVMLLTQAATALGMGGAELGARQPAQDQAAQDQAAEEQSTQDQAAQEQGAQEQAVPDPSPTSSPAPTNVQSFGQKLRSHFSLDNLFPPVNKNIPRMGLQIAYGVADAAAIIYLKSLNWQAQAKIRAIKTAAGQEQDELLNIIREYEKLEAELKTVDKLIDEKQVDLNLVNNEEVELQKRMVKLGDEAQKLSARRIQSKSVKRKLAETIEEIRRVNGRIEYIQQSPGVIAGEKALQGQLLKDRHADLLTRRGRIITDLKALKPKYKTALIPLHTFRGPTVQIAFNKSLGYVFKAGMVLCVVDIGTRLFIWNVLDRNPGFMPMVRVGYAGYKTARDAVYAIDDHTLKMLQE